MLGMALLKIKQKQRVDVDARKSIRKARNVIMIWYSQFLYIWCKKKAHKRNSSDVQKSEIRSS